MTDPYDINITDVAEVDVPKTVAGRPVRPNPLDVIITTARVYQRAVKAENYQRAKLAERQLTLRILEFGEVTKLKPQVFLSYDPVTLRDVIDTARSTVDSYVPHRTDKGDIVYPHCCDCSHRAYLAVIVRLFLQNNAPVSLAAALSLGNTNEKGEVL